MVDRINSICRMCYAFWGKYGKWMEHALLVEYCMQAWSVKSETARSHVGSAVLYGYLKDNGSTLELTEKGKEEALHG